MKKLLVHIAENIPRLLIVVVVVAAVIVGYRVYKTEPVYTRTLVENTHDK